MPIEIHLVSQQRMCRNIFTALIEVDYVHLVSDKKLEIVYTLK